MLDEYHIAHVKLGHCVHIHTYTHTYVHTQHQFIVLYEDSSNIIVRVTPDSAPLKTLSSSWSENSACTPTLHC